MARGGGIYRPPRIRFYTPAQLRQQANQQVRQSIAAQQAPIVSAQKLADARAVAAQKSLQGFGLAAAGILGRAAPLAGQAYRDAAQAESGLAAGYSSQVAGQVRSQVAKSQALIDRLAPGGQVQAGPDPTTLSDTLYAQGGYIPGASNEEQAAAAITQASQEPAIQAGRTQEDILGAQHQQAQDDQQYVQDMLDLAKQEPQLRSQIMQQLQQNELAKRNAWIQQQAQNMVQQRFNVSAGQAQQRISIEQRRMQIAERQGNARLALSAANLRLSQARDRQAVRQALIQGKRIDSSASHAAGYLIDRNGNAILGRNGQRIPVHSSSGGGGKGGVNTGPGSTAYKEAYRYASGTYIDPGIAGQPDPTFTRPAFPKMVSHLANAYGLTRGQARKLLVGLGIKPNGKRP